MSAISSCRRTRSDRRPARCEQRLGGSENRIAFGVGSHLYRRPVGAFDIGARMSTEPHSSQVQERGLAGVAHPLGQVGCNLGDRNRIVAIDGDIAQVRPRRERRLDPTGRRAHTDTETVVLADEHQGHRQPLIRAVRGGVERGSGDRMIGGRIAEAAQRDRVARPWRLHLQFRRAINGERHTDSSRQMRGDRRGLRNDAEIDTAEHLVAATRDRLAGRGDDT